MHSIIYQSKASPTLDSHQIYDMLQAAREQNAQRAITGCLIYHQGQFIQLLEGDKESVQSLYEKIVGDPRHTEITLLTDSITQHRLFSNWNMGFYDFLAP